MVICFGAVSFFSVLIIIFLKPPNDPIAIIIALYYFMFVGRSILWAISDQFLIVFIDVCYTILEILMCIHVKANNQMDIKETEPWITIWNQIQPSFTVCINKVFKAVYRRSCTILDSNLSFVMRPRYWYSSDTRHYICSSNIVKPSYIL